MKKNLLKLLILGLIITPSVVNAAPTASASCSSSGTVTLNNTITVTVSGSSSEAMWDTTMSYDSSKLQYVSGSPLHSISDDFVTGITYTYTFKGVAEGSAYVKTSSAISDYDGQKAFPASSCSINVVKASAPASSSNNGGGSTSSANLSSDNNLTSLSVEGIELSPKFAKDQYEYTAVVENKIDKINIIAKTSHSKASVTGNGEVALEEGENKLKVVVKAENGATRTYTLTITRKEKDPVIVKIDGKKYSILRSLKDIDIPASFKETTIKIGEEEVAALENKKINYTLVVAKDDKGDTYFYKYENGKYTLFSQIVTDGISLIVLDMKDVPTGYKKAIYKINKQSVECYRLSGDSRLLVYGMNLETGKKHYYTYDREEKTLQIFDYDNYEEMVKEQIIMKYLVYGLSAAVVLLLLLVILFASKSHKQKKLINIAKETVIEKDFENKNNKKSKDIKEEVIEESQEDDIYEEDPEDPYDFLGNKKKRKRKK